jgi:FAD/FMN-containing dehydrogenase/Fe-S oxidoreductase
MADVPALLDKLSRATDCELRSDALTRQLYATDASIYQIEPAAVAFPRTADQAARLFTAAADAGVTITPRGAGTGLVGGAIGEGIVVDFAQHNRMISNFDPEQRTVRVGAGVVLDQLNAFLAPHGLRFGPDVATSSRATLGGMIANNSSGSHVPVYGTTVDHVAALGVVLAGGTVATINRDDHPFAALRTAADQIIDQYRPDIAERLPPGLRKRWAGYGFDRYAAHPGDLTQLIAGSEGTLAGIISAELNVVPLPPRRGLGVIFFAHVADAMQATVELLDLQPAAIEHIDRLLFDQSKGQRAFQQARSLLKLDESPCESILLVEFFDDVDDKLAALSERNIGLRKLVCRDEREQQLAWSVRKAGLSLVTGCKGPAKPTTGVEDVCIRPEHLPAYVEALQNILKPIGVEASFYGHAASGLLHVRPKLDLHLAEDVRKLRHIADEVSALCLQFKGSLCGEHGVGIARAEYMPTHLGDGLLNASKQLKRLFDPKNIMNPGKLLPDAKTRIDANLRITAGRELRLPFTPVLGFVEKDESFIRNLEQCNGCGGCRKDAPTMCPTFLATGEEVMSTRGRANTLRAALERRHDDTIDPLDSPQLDQALSHCLSCKACKTECPSNVDLALLKAEWLHAKHQRNGVSLRDRIIAAGDPLGRVGTTFAPLSNAIMNARASRWMMSKLFGFTTRRPLPEYASQRFDRWFSKRTPSGPTAGGRVILWDDTWTRYHEPDIGRAAVRVLEAAGFAVTLANGRRCCGRPAMSTGLLKHAADAGKHNLALLKRSDADAPIIFLEPSCHSMFVDDYKQLRLPDAESVAQRCVLFENFVDDLLWREPEALNFSPEPGHIAIHGHCHAKALTDVRAMPRLAERIPGGRVEWLDTGCCGMAGAFGIIEDKYELSVNVAGPLVDMINALPKDATVVASGTSCRHQINHLTQARPLHMAQVLAGALSS